MSFSVFCSMFKNLDIEKTQDLISNVEVLKIDKDKYTDIDIIQNKIKDIMLHLSRVGEYEIGELYSVFLGTGCDVTEFSIVFKHHYGNETILMKIKTVTKKNKIVRLRVNSIDEFNPRLIEMKYE